MLSWFVMGEIQGSFASFTPRPGFGGVAGKTSPAEWRGAGSERLGGDVV